MKKLFFATNNQGKVEEFKKLFSGYNIEILTPKDLEIEIEPEETGQTFAENAVIKAKYALNKTGIPSVADDSGLEVDYLNGKPGIYSARYGGPQLNDLERTQKLLEELEGVPDDLRTASFRCAIAVAFPNGEIIVEEGMCDGWITNKPYGNKGFGYDPIFYLKEYGKTFGQMDSDIKNKISHRAKALTKIQLKLERWLLREDSDETWGAG